VKKIHKHKYIKLHTWWYTPVMPAIGRPRQKDCEFTIRLGYTGRPCLNKSKKQNKNRNAINESRQKQEKRRGRYYLVILKASGSKLNYIKKEYSKIY
jgi:hypothetical protein